MGKTLMTNGSKERLRPIRKIRIGPVASVIKFKPGELPVVNRRLKAKIQLEFGSQIKFARAVGVSQGLVSQVCTGYKKLGLGEKDLWSVFLKCRIEDIFD